MYYYGGGASCGCQPNPCGGMPAYGPTCGCGGGSSYAIVLVLFILLVIIIGARFIA